MVHIQQIGGPAKPNNIKSTLFQLSKRPSTNIHDKHLPLATRRKEPSEKLGQGCPIELVHVSNRDKQWLKHNWNVKPLHYAYCNGINPLPQTRHDQ